MNEEAFTPRRPWQVTPFLIQGFLIEDDVQIRKLQQCCQHVYVDPSRSVGIDLPGAPQGKPEVPQAPRLAVTTRTVSLMRDGSQQRPDFYEVLRFVRARNEARRTEHAAGPGAPDPGRNAFASVAASISHVAPEKPSTAILPERRRETRASAEDDGGLMQYATSWLKPLSDWLRGDAAADGDADNPAGRISRTAAYKDEVPLEEEMVRAHPLYEEAQNSVEQLIFELEDQRTPDLEQVRHSVAGLVSRSEEHT